MLCMGVDTVYNVGGGGGGGVVSCPASLSHAEKESGETRIQFWFRAARLAASNQIAERCHVIKKRLRRFTMYFALYL